MGKRIDWYDDPTAPEANSIKPSAGTFVTDAQNRVLLIERDDNGNWSMPGGAMDPGESLRACAERETAEETGFIVRATALAGVWSDPLHRIEYTSDGEVRQEFTAIYRAVVVGGEATPSSESVHVEWVDADKVLSLKMDRSQMLRIKWCLTETRPYIDER